MPDTSIIQGTISESDALKQVFMPQVIQRTKQRLDAFAAFINEAENLILNGSIFSIQQTKINATPDLMKEESPLVFKEIEKIVKGGRAFLESLGYKSATGVVPAMLVGNAGRVVKAGVPRGAAALVQPTQTETPGQPPLEGAIISPARK